MRRTRHVVLPVKSWQYIGLLVVSLACLTFGLVSRDREGRHGSLVGPELVYTAAHEVDSSSNDDQVFHFLSTDSSSPVSKSALAVPTTKAIPPESPDTYILVRSTPTNHRSRLHPSHSDVPHLISNQIYNRHLHDPLMHKTQTQFIKRRVIHENQSRRVKSSTYRDSRLPRQFESRVITRVYVTHKRHDIRDSQIDKFKQDRRIEHRLTMDDKRVDPLKTRYTRELYDSGSKQRSLIDSKLQKRQEIRKLQTHNLRSKRQLNSQTYLNEKSKDRKNRAAENQLNLERKYRINNEERQMYSGENRLDNRLVNREYQTRDAKNRYYSKVKDQQRIIDKTYSTTDSLIERRARNSLSQQNLINQNWLRKEAENRWIHESQLLAREKYSKISRLENRRIRSNEDIQNKKYKREPLRLESKQSRSLEDIAKNKRNALRLDNQNIRIGITGKENIENRRRTSQHQNHRLLPMKTSPTRKNLVEHKLMQIFSEINHQNLNRHREITKKIKDRQFTKDISIDQKIQEQNGNNRIIDKIQLGKNELKNLLIDHRNRNLLSKHIKISSNERLQTGNQEKGVVSYFLDQHQINKNNLNDAQTKKEIEGHLDMHTENLNSKSNSKYSIQIETSSMDPQYLKTVIMANNLDYEILQQIIVIAFCAIYGVSVFNSKTTPIGNLVQYANHISIL